MTDTSMAALGEAFMAQAPVTGAAFTLGVADAAREVIWASDQVAHTIARVQFALGEGPTDTAIAAHRPVLVEDVSLPAQMRRWPIFAQQIIDLPVRALFVFPLHLGATTIGVCDCYRVRPEAPSRAELVRLLRALDRVTASLLTSSSGGQDGDGWLTDYDRSRAVIHQATGVLAVQLQVSIPEAFARLRAQAYSQGHELGQAAQEIVLNRPLLDPDPP